MASYQVGKGFDPLGYQATSDADWATLALSESLPEEIAPWRLRGEVDPGGTKAVLAGYSQDRAFAMTADRDCELRQSIDAGRLLLHACRGIKSYSGGPIMVRSPDGVVTAAGIHVAGIYIATMGAGNLALAVSAFSICCIANTC